MKFGKNSNRNNEGISYVDSMLDLMAALVLVLLLVFVLALLYIVKNPDDGFYKKEALEESEELDEDGAGSYDYYDNLEYDNDYDYSYQDIDNGSRQEDWNGSGGGETAGGSGGGGDYGGHEYEFPGNSDETCKAAVHVTVIDAETEKVIQKSGIGFQLFSGSSVLQILNTYYPKKVQYESFETQDSGIYYLPEKIPMGSYYLRDLTAPKGYDLADNVYFTVDEDYDWNDPLEIRIPMYPSRNIIRLQMKDADTQENVGNAVYEVTAAKDIVTFDGTVRYKAGEVVDRMVCGQDGYGETGELFLGEYNLKEVSIPSYYAENEKDLSVNLVNKGSEEDRVLEVKAEKTAYTCTFYDELYPTMSLEGVAYTVQPVTESGKKLTARTVRSDASGQIVLTDLEKSTVYHLKQTARPEGYLADTGEHIFTVSEEGLINESVKESESFYLRMIRLNIGIRDAVIRKLVSDYNTALEDSGMKLIKQWSSNGMVQNLEGIEPGTYYLIIRGNMEKPREIVVKDSCEIQTFYVDVWTMTGIGLCVGGVCILIIVLAVGIVIMKRKTNREKGHGNE